MYNDTPLLRTPLLHKKSGLSKWMASSGEEINIHVLIYIVKWPFQMDYPLVSSLSKGLPLYTIDQNDPLYD